MNVGVRAIFNFAADQTFVTTIGRRAFDFDRVLAIQRFCESARERFQFFQRVAHEQISVAEPPARQRALQQLNALRLLCKIIKSHARLKLRDDAEAKLEAFVTLRKSAF
jgi:hypothetical protein